MNRICSMLIYFLNKYLEKWNIRNIFQRDLFSDTSTYSIVSHNARWNESSNNKEEGRRQINQ
jgi:hypothetical protein